MGGIASFFPFGDKMAEAKFVVLVHIGRVGGGVWREKQDGCENIEQGSYGIAWHVVCSPLTSYIYYTYIRNLKFVKTRLVGYLLIGSRTLVEGEQDTHFLNPNHANKDILVHSCVWLHYPDKMFISITN